MATLDAIKEILEETLDINPEEVTEDATFEDLGIDSLDMAELICDNVVVIDEGVIVEQGKTDDVFNNPQSDVAKKLLEKRL